MTKTVKLLKGTEFMKIHHFSHQHYILTQQKQAIYFFPKIQIHQLLRNSVSLFSLSTLWRDHYKSPFLHAAWFKKGKSKEFGDAGVFNCSERWWGEEQRGEKGRYSDRLSLKNTWKSPLVVASRVTLVFCILKDLELSFFANYSRIINHSRFFRHVAMFRMVAGELCINICDFCRSKRSKVRLRWKQ